MTEPHGGADPTLFTTRGRARRRRVGDQRREVVLVERPLRQSFFIVMAVTEPDVPAPTRAMSMFIVPAETPGIEIVRNVGRRRRARRPRHHTATSATTTSGCRPTTCSAARGRRSSIAQTRLGGGRIHHAMRTIAPAAAGVRHDVRAGAVARDPARGPLAELQMTQEKIADSWIEIEQFRLLVLRTAWLIDKHQRLQAGAQGHRRGQGRDAQGAPRRRPAGDAPARRARRLQRDAVHRA